MAMSNNNGFIVADSTGVSSFTFSTNNNTQIPTSTRTSTDSTISRSILCQQIGTFKAGDANDEVYKSIILSPNEKYLIAVKNTCAYIFTTKDSNCKYKIQKSLDHVTFSPGGSYLVGWTEPTTVYTATNSNNELNFNIWSINDTDQKTSSSSPCLRSPTLVHSQKRALRPIVQFTTDGRLCALLSNFSVHVFNVPNFNNIVRKTNVDLLIRNFSLSPIKSCSSLDNDNNFDQLYVVATVFGTYSGGSTPFTGPMIQLYKYPNLGINPIVSESNEGDKTEIKWNQAGTALVLMSTKTSQTGSAELTEYKSLIYYMDIKGRFKILVESFHYAPIPIEWSPNSTNFCLILGELGQAYKKAVLFNQNLETKTIAMHLILNSIVYNPKGNMVLLAGIRQMTGVITLYDLEETARLCTIPMPMGVDQVVWLNDGEHFITAIITSSSNLENNVFKIWNILGLCIYEWNSQAQFYQIIPFHKNSIIPNPVENKPTSPSQFFNSIISLSSTNKQATTTTTSKSKKSQKSRLLTDFKIIKRLGIGGFGVVIAVMNSTSTRAQSAIKLIPEQTSKFPSKSLYNEVEKLSKLPRHANLVEYITSWKESLNSNQLNQLLGAGVGKSKLVKEKLNLAGHSPSLDVICIQMELCESDLRKWITTRNKNTQADTEFNAELDIFNQLLNGLEHIHRHDLIHRDLKPSNTLLCGGLEGGNLIVKIGDFGLAVLHVDETSTPGGGGGSGGDCHTANAGNAFYKAPEQIYSNYGKAVDIFALGLILYELLDRSITNVSASFMKLRTKNELPYQVYKAQPKISQLILDMIKLDPDSRPTLAKIRAEVSNHLQSPPPPLSHSLSVAAATPPPAAMNIATAAIHDWYSDASSCSCCLSNITTSANKYKCVICPNIILCSICEAHNKYTHGSHTEQHPMLKLKSQQVADPIDKPMGSKSGCEHYRRRCKIMCPNINCKKLYWCNWCHDNAVPDHVLDRYKINVILCIACGATQLPSQECSACSIKFAQYYCPVCHLYDNCDSAAQLYWHCDKCGICRKKESVGLNYVHCDVCWKCFATGSTHNCQRSKESECSIWHYVHKTSKTEYLSVVQIKCPVCSQW